MSLKQFLGPTAVFAFFAVPSIALAQASTWPLQAQSAAVARARYADDQPASYYDLRRRAYDQGYREGLQEGEKDGRRGDRFAYQDEREFQRADRGYNRQFGDRERYRQIFRDGYVNGYSDGYSRYSRNGRYDRRPGDYRQGPYGQQGGWGSWGGGAYGRYPNSGYYSQAIDNGARDGYEKGLEDARKNRSFDPRRHSWYRSGDRHYENRYGSREQYKDVYREGFQRGYERGYQENRYRR
jgi:flagellar biosynthesis/type III secretory pathway protein FliH